MKDEEWEQQYLPFHEQLASLDWKQLCVVARLMGVTGAPYTLENPDQWIELIWYRLREFRQREKSLFDIQNAFSVLKRFM